MTIFLEDFDYTIRKELQIYENNLRNQDLKLFEQQPTTYRQKKKMVTISISILQNSVMQSLEE